MTAIVTMVRLKCNVCETTILISPCGSIQQGRRRAADMGWAHEGKTKDYCPACVAKLPVREPI